MRGPWMTDSRVARGRKTQVYVAEWFGTHGWPQAVSNPASLPGKDILGMPGLAPEVKARRELRLNDWLKQASRQDGLPFVVHRPDGYGPSSIRLWPVTFRLEDATELLSVYARSLVA